MFVGGRGETKEESVRREEWMRSGWKKNCYNQNDFFFFFSWSYLLIAKGLFDVNMKFLSLLILLSDDDDDDD